MTGEATRDRLWEELYFSKELHKAAKHLIPNGDLWQDLLSDSIIDVLARKDVAEVYGKGKLPAMVFMYMRNHSTRKRTGWNQQFGSMEMGVADVPEVGLNRSLMDGNEVGFDEWQVVTPSETEPEPPEDITSEELEYAEQLFGQVTAKRIRLMRAVDEADGKKETNRKEWESAQCAKLYLGMGSYRKVAKAIGTSAQTVCSRVKKFTSNMTDSKLNISVVTYSQEPKSGMELYRLHYPYFSGVSATENVKQASYEYMAQQPIGGLESDVYVFSRVQFPEIVDKVLEANKKIVVDIDDYLKLNKEHPKYGTEENKRYVANVTYALQKAHLVTTTTQKLADKLKEDLGIDATVIKNTIPEDADQFKGETIPHSKVRFLYVGGVFHQHDVAQVYDGLKKLYTDPRLKEKFQICLAGFNNNSEYRAYEKVFTADYKAQSADAEYLDYLKLLTPMLDHLGYNKNYRRIWARPVVQYGLGYREGDVVLIPLAGDNEFAACKSELKLIEAGMTGKAAIVSDVLPYSPHLIHEDNCLKVSPTRRDWYTQMRRMIVDEDLRGDVSANLSKYVRKEFSHQKEVSKLTSALRGLK